VLYELRPEGRGAIAKFHIRRDTTSMDDAHRFLRYINPGSRLRLRYAVAGLPEPLEPDISRAG